MTTAMSNPSLAVLDGDIIAYRAACWADVEGVEDLDSRLRCDVSLWTPRDVENVIVSLSCSRKDNYRRDVWKSYKQHRDVRPDPDSLAYAKDFIRDAYHTVSIPRLEADDIMGLSASSGKAIAVTIDKDLLGVPGWHWNPDKDNTVRFISERDADRWFARQIISGDTTDGVPGLPGRGPAYFKNRVLQFHHEDWFQEIFWCYEEEGYDMDYFLSQAICVRILRSGEYNKETERITFWELPNLLAL